MEHYFENNRQLWNRRTELHRDSQFYDLQSFKKGQNTLKSVEMDALGNVQKKSLLHLQCHFGLDTLSWERLGAMVTGVDFSENAIDLAIKIRDEQGLKARFIRANIYDLPQFLDETFDVIFTSYGVLCWLPDIKAWAQLIARFLNPGGVFYIVEFHPVIMMFDERSGEMLYSYFHQQEPIEQHVEYTYANDQEPLNHREYSWNHSLSDVVNALIAVGLQVEGLHEYPFSSYNCFPNLELNKDGYYWEKHRKGIVPLMFSIKVSKRI